MKGSIIMLSGESLITKLKSLVYSEKKLSELMTEGMDNHPEIFTVMQYMTINKNGHLITPVSKKTVGWIKKNGTAWFDDKEWQSALEEILPLAEADAQRMEALAELEYDC